ncbi:uncharacterized protein LOC123316109 [Coccinella septempunctata]|uniref:uncharacterized protein LOC123316109 n=1 Tax=Coccinella septempunctata TaxID=41139 RepID=UPI001D08A2FF|nr:uncharacterized protein LOC123316109 [Coccinella septempunctata]
MSLKKPQESGSYMDNVKVKIAEEYKPPPKINIPMTHNQRLTFNKHVQNNLPNYDFSMESNILRKVKEWKTNRLIKEEQRKARLQSLKEKEQADDQDCEEAEESVETNVPTSHVNEVEVSSVGPSCTTSYSNGMLMPTKANNYYSNILQPIPSSLGPNGQASFGSSSGVKSPFNISEFEADTSSPFDNVALKSINDVEELAKVLKIEDDTSKLPTASYSNFNITSNLQTYPNYSNMSNYPSLVSCNTQNSVTGINGYYNSCDMNPMRSFTSGYQCSPPNNYVKAYNSNHIAPREKVDGENPRQTVNFTGSKTKSSPESMVKKSDKAPVKNVSQNDPFDELSKDLQEFSRNISSMGFPLPRVARTCQALGKDNKKVVDHLLAMSELLDLGFAEDKVCDALLQCDNDRDKALDKLIS